MSRTVARLLIAFLLALAVPVQGMAASSAGLCMAMGGHHDGHGTVTDHGHAAASDDGAEHHHAANNASPDTEKSSDKAHCPPCVSCCAAAVIAPALQLPSAQHSASAAVATIACSVPGALPDELDRPPLAL